MVINNLLFLQIPTITPTFSPTPAPTSLDQFELINQIKPLFLIIIGMTILLIAIISIWIYFLNKKISNYALDNNLKIELMDKQLQKIHTNETILLNKVLLEIIENNKNNRNYKKKINNNTNEISDENSHIIIKQSELIQFTNDLQEEYLKISKNDYIPLQILKNNLREYSDFDDYLFKARRRFPELFRIEVSNDGLLLIKVTNRGISRDEK